MKMKQASGKQQGFTIIELVVVILLLGILAATALPRFMNLSTEAHNGVISGVEGSMRSGLALYRANWTAQGQPEPGTEVAESLLVAGAFVRSGDPEVTSVSGTIASGFPFGTTGSDPFVRTDVDSANCTATLANLVEVSGITIRDAATALPADEDALPGAVDTLLTANDADIYVFDAVLEDESLAVNTPVTIDDELDFETCVYLYTGERGNVDRGLIYLPFTGDLIRFTSAEALFDAVQP